MVEELIFSSVDEVTYTSIVGTWSWEELGGDWITDAAVELAISPVEADSTNVTVFGGV